jgi:hypothetical protein
LQRSSVFSSSAIFCFNSTVVGLAKRVSLSFQFN